MSRPDLLTSLARLVVPGAAKGQLPNEDVERALSLFCTAQHPDSATGHLPRMPDVNFKHIASLLRRSNSQTYGDTSRWHGLPRIYTVLRTIGCLSVMNVFVENGYTDSTLPFESAQNLPPELGDKRGDFIKVQDQCLTPAVELEKGFQGKHLHFNKEADIHLSSMKRLGSGGYGHVDVVWSRLSLRTFARKRFLRASPRFGVESLRSFERETAVLKRLSHIHLVKIMGSYTDPHCFAFLMQPVADCNLLTYLDNAKPSQSPDLRSFFGCLANAVAYLHGRRIHHMDIKPENILIKREKIYLTDFGTAHDWSEKERSTTWSTAPRTPRYMPPEVSRDAKTPRNHATDMWSLGVVYLEMVTVLRGEKITSLRKYLMTRGTKHAYVYGNAAATYAWLEILRTKERGNEYDNEPLSWVKDMIEPRPENRPSANQIREQSLHPNSTVQFCGLCCSNEQPFHQVQPSPIGSVTSESDSIVGYDEIPGGDDASLHGHTTRPETAKNHAIDSWISRTTEFFPVVPHIYNEDEISMPFDITVDDDDKIDRIGELDRQIPIPRRFADFDLLAIDSQDTPDAFSTTDEAEDQEFPFDVEYDDNDSDFSVQDFPAKAGGSQGTADQVQDIFEQLEEVDLEFVDGSITELRIPAPPYSLSSGTLDYNNPNYALRSNRMGVTDFSAEITQKEWPTAVQDRRDESFTAELAVTSSDENRANAGLSPTHPPFIFVETAPENELVEDKTSYRGSNPIADIPVEVGPRANSEERSADKPVQAAGSVAKFKESTETDLKTGDYIVNASGDLTDVPKSVPLTTANLKKATKDISIRVRAKSYLQEIRETQSSAATSVMSEATRKKLAGAGSMIAWQDQTMRLLDSYCSKGKVQAVRVCLGSGCNPGTKAKPRPGPLLKAVRGATPKHTKCVVALIEAGADINVVSSSTGKSPLHLAIEHSYFEGYYQLIWILLGGGADPNIRDNNGDYPILQILYGGYEPLEKHRREALALLLQPDMSTDVNIRPPGTLNMPLHLAVRRKDPWAVAMLLEKGAKVNKKNGSGLTPFAMAANSISADTTDTEKEVMRLLLKYGANVEEKIGTTERTAIQIATNNERGDLVQLFKKYLTGSETGATYATKSREKRSTSTRSPVSPRKA